MRLANFEINERLYTGQSTVVYAGRRTSDQVSIVAKLITGGLRDLQRECSLLQRVAGPGLVEAFGIFESSEGPVLVQKRFGDGTVEDLCQHGAAPLRAALQVGIQLAEILMRVHRCRILHRDIKPANLLYDSSTQRIAVADFGSALELPVTARSVLVNDLVGTPAYIAPEQTGRTREPCDARSDLYSTGITLYQLLTGSLPFASMDILEQVAAQLSKTPLAPELINPAVPKAVSDIVMRLLAKLPEQRYQSAKGLAADLRRCLAAVERAEPLASFVLGEADVLRPKFPRELFGRGAALATLSAAHQRAASGRPELVVVSGRSGMGRSQLLRTLLDSVPSASYAIGSCNDQSERPLSGLARALSDLATRLLTLDEAALEQMRQRVVPALGRVGQALVEIAPELGMVLGEQAALPELGPAQARARLRHAFRCFVAALSGELPCVLVLEEADRADPASLDLIESALCASEQTRVLIVLTTSNPEALVELGKLPNSARIELAPLPLEAVISWTAATLGQPVARVAELGTVLAEKSGGNPGVLTQLIEHFLDVGVIDREAGAYVWNVAEVRAAEAPQSLGSTLAQRVNELGERQRLALFALVCHEEPAPLSVVAALLQEAPELTAKLLGALESEGLLVSKASAFSIAHAAVAKAALVSCPAPLLRELNARLVEHLLAAHSDAELAENPYLIAKALDQAQFEQTVTDRAQRARAALLYERAGAQALNGMAYPSACSYFERGFALLAPEPFAQSRSLALRLTVGRCRALTMLKDNERGEQIFQQLCQQDLSATEIGLVYQSRIDNLSMMLPRDRAVAIGLEGLARLGVELPLDPAPQAPFVVLQKNEAQLGILTQDEIVHYREMTDPRPRAAISILSTVMLPITMTGRSTLMLLGAETAISLFLEHGRERYTASFLVTHGMMMQGALKDFEGARRYYAASVALEAASPAPEVGARTGLVMGLFLSSWFDAPADAIACLQRGIQLGVEVGDPLFTVLSISAVATLMMMSGAPLGRVQNLIETRSDLLRGDSAAWANAANILNLCNKLTGGEPIEEADLAQITAVPASAGSMRTNPMVNFGIALCVIGFEAQVRAWLAEIGPLFPRVNFAQPHLVTVRFLEGLFAAKDAEAGTADRLEVARKAHQELCQIEKATGAKHHRASILLLEAEIARASGELDLATGRYGRAIAQARALEQTQFVAFGLERRAELLAAAGVPDDAELSLREAYIAYKRWGHLTKASQLEAAHPALRALPGGTRTVSRAGHTQTGTLSATVGSKTTAINDALDLATVLAVSQEISTELQASNVVRKVLSGIAQNAGAERALLVLRDAAGAEQVYAELVAGEYRALGVPLVEYDQLPESMLRVVRRTKSPLVLADAANEASYKQDPFVIASKPRSIACVPVLRKGELSGFVVLENRLVVGAFTPQLLSLTSALIAQATISLDNASLYENMEQRVHERTVALNARNAKMRIVLDNVAQGLVVVDRAGALSSERSAVLERWFPDGVPSQLCGFFDHDPRLAQSFDINWQQLLDGFMPLALCIDQLPRQLIRGGRTFEFAWQPLTDERGELSSMLVVLSDVTEVRQRERAEQVQRQLMVIFEKILADQHAVSAFVHETDQLVSEIAGTVERADVEKRLLHTLKGNTAIFGLSDLSAHCHALESLLELDLRRLSPDEREQLAQLWRTTRAGFERFLNAQQHGLHVPLENYQVALDRLRQDRHSLAGDLELWKLESARSRFERIAEQAHKLAERLKKAPITVEIEDSSVYFVDEVWTSFWSAFVHVLRNALDHGLESPEERMALGKRAGSLRLRAYLSERAFVLEVSDDGRGIAWERLRDKARAVGLPADTHEQLLAALFADGVSTKDQVDELSGRGVGLAALRAACDQMRADIEVTSTQGEGTTWRFVFPPELVRAPRSISKRLRPSLSA